MNEFHEVQAPNKESTLKRVSMAISGNVQGVFFRQSVQEWADSLGIAGFAENRDDGSLYIEAEGESEDLECFIDWCRQGPPQAKVEHIEQRALSVENQSGFAVR